MEIVLYTTHCPRCEVLKKKLDSAGVTYSICEDEEEMVKKGFLSAPVLEVNGEYKVFKDAVDWINGGATV